MDRILIYEDIILNIIYLWIVLDKTEGLFIGIVTFICYFLGAGFTVQPTIVVDLLGVDNAPRAMAFFTMSLGFGFLLSVPLAGMVRVLYTVCAEKYM